MSLQGANLLFLAELPPMKAAKIAKFEIPTVVAARLRAFRVHDIGAYAAMQANPEVMRYLVTGHTAPRPTSAQGGGGLSRGSSAKSS
jgi:hypothetical protein